MDAMKGVGEREPWQRAPPPSMHVPAVVMMKGHHRLMGGGSGGLSERNHGTEKSQKLDKSLSSSRDRLGPLGDTAVTVVVATPALKRFKTNNHNSNNSNSNDISSSVVMDAETALRLHASLTSKQPRARPTIRHPQSSTTTSTYGSSSSSSSSAMTGVLSWSLDTSKTARDREPSRDGKYNHAQLGRWFGLTCHDAMISHTTTPVPYPYHNPTYTTIHTITQLNPHNNATHTTTLPISQSTPQPIPHINNATHITHIITPPHPPPLPFLPLHCLLSVTFLAYHHLPPSPVFEMEMMANPSHKSTMLSAPLNGLSAVATQCTHEVAGE